MASQTTLKLPTVDFSQLVETENMKPGTEAWDLVRARLEKIVVEYGCFEVVYPKVSKEESQLVLSQLQKLFALPVETKMKNNIMEGKPFRGFIKNERMPLYESLGIECGDNLESAERFANLMWPNESQDFSKIIASWTKKVAELGEIIRRMILQILGVENYYDFHLQSTNNYVRFNHYKAPENGTATLSLGDHTDVGMLTILLQSGVNGLEFRIRSGEWITAVPSSLGSFFVFIADSLMVWSNGRLYSPLHRVMMSGEVERFAIGLFTIPKRGCLIQAPDELVDEEHPLLYKPFDHHDFLDVYFKNPWKGGQPALLEFAGIHN